MIALSPKLLLTETQVLCWQSEGACGYEQQPCCPASSPKCLTSHQTVAFGLQADVILAPTGQLLVGVALSVWPVMLAIIGKVSLRPPQYLKWLAWW